MLHIARPLWGRTAVPSWEPSHWHSPQLMELHSSATPPSPGSCPAFCSQITFSWLPAMCSRTSTMHWIFLQESNIFEHPPLEIIKGYHCRDTTYGSFRAGYQIKSLICGWKNSIILAKKRVLISICFRKIWVMGFKLCLFQALCFCIFSHTVVTYVQGQLHCKYLSVI